MSVLTHLGLLDLMSATSRRRCRVQGAWAGPVPKDNESGGSRPQGQTTYHGRMLNNQALLYRDPKKDKMASLKPYNFSWVIPGLLAGSGLPERPAHTQYILEEKINILVSLTEWKPNLHLAAGLHHVHLPVQEFAPPSLSQAIEFVSLVEEALKNKQAVAVHCHWGRGRTGTLIACYLVKAQGWDPVQAITYTRKARPHSVETYQQEQLVADYHQHLQQSS